MTKIVTMIGTWFVLVSGAFAQTVGLSRPPEGLLWPVQTERIEAYNCSGDAAEKPWRVSEAAYDRRGNVLSQVFYNADGSVGHQVSHTFDADGNETGWAEFYGKRDFPPAGLRKHADFTLSGGKVISVVVYKEDTPEFKTTRQYDIRGNMIREVIVEIGFHTTTRTFKYDRLNRLIESAHDSYGRASVNRRTYDAVGNVIKDTHSEKGVLIGTITRVFDGDRLLKEISAWKDGDFRTTINTYDKTGKLILTKIDDPSITSTTAIEYHDNGKIRSKDQVTIAKVGGRPQSSEASPTPGRILEKYDINGRQTERYFYDQKGDLYSTQLSSHDDSGRQARLIETSRLGPAYNRDLVYERDSRGNQTGVFCRNVTPNGEVKLSRSEKRIITYYDN